MVWDRDRGTREQCNRRDLGGYITTWLRGRIERDEAMRNRLIECADEFVDSMTNALLAFDAATLMDAAGGRRKLRDTTGELSDDIVECLDSARGYSEKAHTALTRVELLYGWGESGPYDEGLRAADSYVVPSPSSKGKGLRRRPFEPWWLLPEMTWVSKTG